MIIRPVPCLRILLEIEMTSSVLAGIAGMSGTTHARFGEVATYPNRAANSFIHATIQNFLNYVCTINVYTLDLQTESENYNYLN